MKIQQTNLKMNLDAIKDLESYMEKGKENFLELAPNFEAFTDLLSTEMIKKIKQLQSEKKDLLMEYTPTNIPCSWFIPRNRKKETTNLGL